MGLMPSCLFTLPTSSAASDGAWSISDGTEILEGRDEEMVNVEYKRAERERNEAMDDEKKT